MLTNQHPIADPHKLANSSSEIVRLAQHGPHRARTVCTVQCSHCPIEQNAKKRSVNRQVHSSSTRACAPHFEGQCCTIETRAWWVFQLLTFLQILYSNSSNSGPIIFFDQFCHTTSPNAENILTTANCWKCVKMQREEVDNFWSQAVLSLHMCGSGGGG